MEKISDILKDLKERVSNPLISSFLISWLVFNWKIVIGLLFYKSQELQVDNYTSYIDLITKNSSANRSLFHPLYVSLGYTFIFPFIRNFILAFNSWIKAWGSTLNLRLSRKGNISVAKYIQLRSIYEERTNLLQNVIKEESSTLKNYENEKNITLKLSSEKNELTKELLSWKASNDITMLDGEWEIHYANKPQHEIQRIRILNGNIEHLDQPAPKNPIHSIIRLIYRYPNSSQLSFCTLKTVQNGEKSYHFFQFSIMDNMNLLRGFEDEAINVEFRKLK